MDKTIASWILQFVLRQPIEDWIANELLSILPVSDDDLSLKKTILIRRISSEISKNSVSETTLDSLELIVDLDRALEIGVSESMKTAYWASAIECTAHISRESRGSSIDAAIDRIWNSRVAEVVKLGDGVGLVSDRLKDMQMVVKDPEIRDKVFGRDTLTFALDSVKVYLEEAREQMGPSFLEIAAVAEVMNGEKYGGDEIKNVRKRRCGSMELEDVLEGEEDDCTISSGSNVIDLDDDCASNAESEPAVGDKGRRTKISGRSYIDVRKDSTLPIEKEGRLGDKCDFMFTPEVIKLQEALRSSSANLHSVVEDPLPDALKIAARVQSNMGMEHVSQKGPEENENQASGDITDIHSSSANKDVESALGEETRSKYHSHHDGISRPSIMVRNETAQTYEWDDSIDSPEKSQNCSRKLGLPSPKHKTVSPSDRQEVKNIVNRRKTRWWSPEEEETLRQAVQAHGKGNWKHILCCYPEVFEGRTEVDLKDKWRNLTREIKVPKY